MKKQSGRATESVPTSAEGGFSPGLSWSEWILWALRNERVYDASARDRWYTEIRERKKAKVVPITRGRQADNGTEKLL